MKKTLLLLTFLAVSGMTSTSAQAATHYVSGFGGISWMKDIDATDYYVSSPGGENNTTNTELGSGLALTGAIGCDYGHYRLEAEVGYQRNSVKSIGEDYNGGAYYFDGPNGPSTLRRQAMRGDISVLTLMGNGYYDFDLGSKVELYATAGVGVAQVSSHDVNNTTNYSQSSPYTPSPVTDPGYNNSETTLAWQVGAGLAAPIADHVKLDLRYRYFATTDFTAYDGIGNWSNMNISSHSVLLGLRVDF